MFKDTVHEAQESAETRSQFDFDVDEVDYGEEDEEMKEEAESEDVEIEIDEQEEDEIDAQQEDADRETEERTNQLPAWAMNLEAGCKKWQSRDSSTSTCLRPLLSCLTTR